MPGGSIFNASIQGQQNRSKIYYMDGIVNTSVRAGSYVALPDIDCAAGIQGPVAERQGGVRRRPRRRGEHDVEVGRQPLHRVRLRHGPQREARGAESVPRFQPQRPSEIPPEPVRRETSAGRSFETRRSSSGRTTAGGYSDVANVRASVPSAQESWTAISRRHSTGRQIYNPFTTRVVNGVTIRDPFEGNIIPQNLISPTMQAFLKAYMVKPNLPGQRRKQLQLGPLAGEQLEFIPGADRPPFLNSDNVFFRWTERRIGAFIPRGDRGFIEPDSINRNFGGGWFHSFNSNLILELRGGLATQPTEDAPSQHELGVRAACRDSTCPSSKAFRATSWMGSRHPGRACRSSASSGPRPRGNPNWNAAADMSWLRGKHNLKGGFQMLQINRLQKNQFGQMTFSAGSHAQSAVDRAIRAIRSRQRCSGCRAESQGFVHDLGYIDFKTSTISGYVQDTWAIRPNITLNYGLRYDYVTRAIRRRGRAVPERPRHEDRRVADRAARDASGVSGPAAAVSADALINTIPANQYIRVTGERNSLLKPITDNWGPRAGIAWQLNDLTVFRTSYALMWDSMVSTQPVRAAPVRGLGMAAVLRHRYRRDQPRRHWRPACESRTRRRCRSWRSAPGAVEQHGFYNDPDRKNAYSHQYHVELQRQITNNLMVGAAYVGSRTDAWNTRAGRRRSASRASSREPDGATRRRK